MGTAQVKRTEGQSHQRQLEWLMSDDTGMSSQTIFSVMTRTKSRLPYGTPLDADDFGRCHRLLNKFPEWRERLNEVALLLPEWGPLVREWSRLTELYLKGAERDEDWNEEFYAVIAPLITESRKARDFYRTFELNAVVK